MELEECSICLSNLEYEVAITSCNHRYHFDCITYWINKNKINKCPLCNREFEICMVTNKDDKKNKESDNLVENDDIDSKEFKYVCCSIL